MMSVFLRIAGYTFFLVSVHVNGDIFEISASENNTHYLHLVSKLQKDLLVNYNRNTRPVKKESSRVNVTIVLELAHIDDVDEVQQVMKIHGTMHIIWYDEYLQWNSKEKGTNKIHIPLWYIWKPDINVYNSASGKDDWHVSYAHPAWVYSNGLVQLNVAVTFRVTCSFDFTNYPYDKQNCSIIIGSWRYNRDQVEMSHGHDDMLTNLAWNQGQRVHMSGWKIIGTGLAKMYRNSKGSTIEPIENAPNWSELHFWIEIQRHEPYFTITFLIPAVCCAFFTCLGLWLNNERLQMLLLFSNLILQNIFLRGLVMKMPPSTGDIPRIVRFYGLSICLNFIAIIICTVLANISIAMKEPPPFLRNWLAIYQRAWSKIWRQNQSKLESNQEDLSNQAATATATQPAAHSLASQTGTFGWHGLLPIIRCLWGSLFLFIYCLSMIVLLV